MRALLHGIIISLFLAGGNFLLNAQANTTTNVQPANPQLAREISFLTPAQQEKYAKARAKALADNPKLKTDGETLMRQAEAVMTKGTAADRQTFIEKMNSHRQKLRQAMVKEDSSLGPIFVEIDKQISETKAKQLGQMQSSSGATNAPAASPTTH